MSFFLANDPFPVRNTKMSDFAMIIVDDSIKEVVRTISGIARQTLLQQGSHLPTAVLHTLEGMVTFVLPFKDDVQKKALVDYVRKKALESHAYAVTTVTSARIVDSRSGRRRRGYRDRHLNPGGGSPTIAGNLTSETVTATSLLSGNSWKGRSLHYRGQMLIIPDWDRQTRH